jgi:hypothetical protein
LFIKFFLELIDKLVGIEDDDEDDDDDDELVLIERL